MRENEIATLAFGKFAMTERGRKYKKKCKRWIPAFAGMTKVERE